MGRLAAAGVAVVAVAAIALSGGSPSDPRTPAGLPGMPPPLLPVAVVGSEEQAPSLGSFKPLAKLLGMPAFPLVLTPIPLPSRYTIYFGEPMTFSGSHDDEDQVIEEKVERVKERIRAMLKEGLRRRGSVFF